MLDDSAAFGDALAAAVTIELIGAAYEYAAATDPHTQPDPDCPTCAITDIVSDIAADLDAILHAPAPN